MLINERSPEIARFLDEWRNNRAMIEGERAVKGAGERFLPRDASMDIKTHANMLTRTPFYPGSARTHEGLKALAARKAATITAPTNVLDILNTITARGYTLSDLAARILSELLITNFVGLIVDYPASAGGLTKAQAIAKGVRPFVAMYTAENILGIETGVINNRQRVTRVRLHDDTDTIRELRLDDGVYTVTIWKLTNGGWTAGATFTPTGPDPIDEIPFTLVATEEDFEPSKAPLTDVCSLNAQLFLASANLAQCDWWSCSPIPYIIKKSVEDEAEISVAPGTVWRFDCLPSEAEVGYVEWKGAQITELAARVDSLKGDMAKMGSRMLAPDKAVAEAADTEAIRRASENAMLANITRVRDRKLNDALSWVAWWLDLEEDAISFEANSDFNAIPLDAQSLAFRMSLFQAGLISRDALIDILIAEDVLPETYDREADAQKIAEEIADRPPAIVMPVANDNTGQDDEPAS